MSSFPRVEICDSGVNFYCIWKGCLAVSQHLILLILLRIQHSKRPWTRAEFYCPSHPKKKDILSFGYCYGLEQNCFLQARVFECLSLGRDHCFWETWSHSRRGLPGRAGHYVWAFENTAQAWFPSVLGFQAQRSPEASSHFPAASSQASPSATSSSPGWTVFLKAGARGNPSFHKVFVC